jgi:lambda family phage minor tail protein L
MLLDLNKQRVDSEIVELFEIVIDNATVRFTNHPTNFKFPERNSPFIIREYTALPLYFSGYEQKAEGAYSRPVITFANILSTFKNSIGVSNNDLIGKKLTRRKTLAKYEPEGNPGTNGSIPTEMPIQVFIIDRIESENAQAITFELTSGFDLQGISVPNRYILANTCTWLYQGRERQSSGGCTWKITNDNPGFTVRYDSNDRPLITGAVNNTLASLTGQSVTVDNVYKIANGNRFDYYQAITTTSSSTSASFRRCRLIEGAWNSSPYVTYTQGKLYNPIVTYDDKVWVAVASSENVTPGTNEFVWERIDVCGKKLTSCAIRYKAVNFTGQSYSVPRAVKQNSNKILPYGGFPGAKRFNR